MVKYSKGSPVLGFKGVTRQSMGHPAPKKVIQLQDNIVLSSLWLNVDSTLNVRSCYT